MTSQSAPVACFRSAANYLETGGAFVIEVLLPRLQQVPVGKSYHAFDVSETHSGIDDYDIATQSVIFHHLSIVDDQARRSSIPNRYVWPTELDLMAELAGLKLLERCGGWNREPFTNSRGIHVTVWQKAARC